MLKMKVFILIACIVAVVVPTLQDNSSEEHEDHEDHEDHNNKGQCTSAENGNEIGMCLNHEQCRKSGGTATTSCSKNNWTCCIDRRTCGGQTRQNVTYFVNPNFPKEDSSIPDVCGYEVTTERNVCQVRIDFLSFNLSQPNEDGACTTDRMVIKGGISDVPNLCGFNTGQHLYVSVKSQGSLLQLFVLNNVTKNASRLFNIQISQIPCASLSRAPSGCLQYFTTTFGTVQSFNFPINPQKTFFNNGNNQLSNTEYGICVRPEEGVCSISWLPNPKFAPYNFFVTSISKLYSPSVIGTIKVSDFGDKCQSDFVIIPGGEFKNASGKSASSDRFCGAGFPASVTSTFQPFQMFVQTDEKEFPYDEGNFGFSLNFIQNLC